MGAFTLSIAAALCATTLAAQAPTWSAGAAAGQLRFSDGSKESAIGATIVAHVRDWLDVSVNPTYARVQTVAVQSGTTVVPARTASGYTDLPVSIGVSRPLPGTWSPSVGFSLGVTLPIGDTAALGSGHMAIGASASVGVAPSDDRWFSVGAGRSLSNGFSSALAASSSTSLALSGGTAAGPLRLSASLSGDVGPVPAGLESARSVAAGVAVPVGLSMSLTVDGSAGLTSAAPAWAYSVALGTTPAGIVAASAAPFQRLRQAFGVGTGARNKPKAGKP